MTALEAIQQELDEKVAERQALRETIDLSSERFNQVEREIDRLTKAIALLRDDQEAPPVTPADQPAKTRVTAAEALSKVKEYLTNGGTPKSVKDIAADTGLNTQAVAKALRTDGFVEVTGKQRNGLYTTAGVAKRVGEALEKAGPALMEEMQRRMEEQEAINRAMTGDHARDHDGFAVSEDYDPAPMREDFPLDDADAQVDTFQPEVGPPETEPTVFSLEDDDDDDNSAGFALSV